MHRSFCVVLCRVRRAYRVARPRAMVVEGGARGAPSDAPLSQVHQMSMVALLGLELAGGKSSCHGELRAELAMSATSSSVSLRLALCPIRPVSYKPDR